jgi:hypothetical protein
MIVPLDIDYYRMAEQRKIAQIQAVDEDLEVLVIGNSHASALDPRYLNVTGATLARAGGDLLEARYTLESLVPGLPKLNTVYVAVSYYTFLTDNGAGGGIDLRRASLYRTVPSWRVIQGDWPNYVVGKTQAILPLQSVARPDNWRPVVEELLSETHGSVPRPVPTNLQGDRNDECDDRSQYLDSQAQERLAHIDTIKITPELERGIYRSLVDTVVFLKSEGIRVIFFTPTYWKGYNQLYQTLAPEHITKLKSNMRRLQQEFGVEYYDMSRYAAFESDATLFLDSNHFNACGRQVFTEQLTAVAAR